MVGWGGSCCETVGVDEVDVVKRVVVEGAGTARGVGCAVVCGETVDRIEADGVDEGCGGPSCETVGIDEVDAVERVVVEGAGIARGAGGAVV